MFENLKVGEKIFVVKIRKGIRPVDGEYCTVTKVGRKFFYVHIRGYLHTKFRLSDGLEATNTSPDWQAFFTEKEWLDSVNHQILAEVLAYELTQHPGKFPLKDLIDLAKSTNISVNLQRSNSNV